MEKFVRREGLVAPMDRANVDTDAIIPKQYLKSIKRTGYGPNLFDEWRYLDHGEPAMDHSKRPLNPDFVLNQPRYHGATVLLARENFGCGSSREHAPWALLQYGFQAVIARGGELEHGLTVPVEELLCQPDPFLAAVALDFALIGSEPDTGQAPVREQRRVAPPDGAVTGLHRPRERERLGLRIVELRDLRAPAALGRWGLSGRAEGATDTCAVYQVLLDVAAGADAEAVFVLGQGDTRQQALDLAQCWL